MQDSALMQKLNKVLTGRFLKFLEEQAEKDPADLREVLHRVPAVPQGGRGDGFHRTGGAGETAALRIVVRWTKGKLTSLADYVKRMPSEQKEIYYLLAPNRDAAREQPVFRSVQGAQVRGAVPVRSVGRVRHGAPARVRRQSRSRPPRKPTEPQRPGRKRRRSTDEAAASRWRKWLKESAGRPSGRGAGLQAPGGQPGRGGGRRQVHDL